MSDNTVNELGQRELPLQGIAALEVGGSLPGRLLAKILSDQGAAVVSIEQSGPNSSPYDFDRHLDRREMDLATSEGKRDFAKLASSADVVIDGMSGGLSKVGADYETLSTSNQQLIFCRLDAFPAESDLRSDDYVEWMIAGEFGLHRPDNKEPVRERLSVMSAFGAAQAAVYIAAGLIQRERAGCGSRIDISLFGAATILYNTRLLNVRDPQYGDPRGTFSLPISGRYKCGDGRYINLHASVDSVASSNIRGMGHPEWLDEALAGLEALETKEQEDVWRERFRTTFASRPAHEWEAAIDAEGGACVLCRTREEWKSEPHAYDTGILERDGNGRTVVGPAVRLFASAANQGQATPSWPNRTTNERLPLAGIRVVDLAMVLAGPTCGRLLAEFGADVIKVDSPGRTGQKELNPWNWLAVNRTKRSILLDAKTERGRDVLWRLIKDADVVLENWRDGKFASLGFTFDALAKANARISYVSLNAHDFGGRFSGLPGWDPNGEAMVGMQTATAQNGVPRRSFVPTNDFGTGYLTAFGALLAIYAVHKSGRPQRVLSSLARTGTFLQTVEFSGDSEAEPTPQVQFVETADEAVAVSGLADLQELQDTVRNKTSMQAVALATSRGLAACTARKNTSIPKLEWMARTDLIRTWQHPHWGEMNDVFAHGTATSFEQRRGHPSPNPGEHTREVLGELHFTESEIESLLGERVVVDELPLFPST